MPVITTKPFKELASYSRFLNLLQFHAGVTVFLSSGHLGGFFFDQSVFLTIWSESFKREEI